MNCTEYKTDVGPRELGKLKSAVEGADDLA